MSTMKQSGRPLLTYGSKSASMVTWKLLDNAQFESLGTSTTEEEFTELDEDVDKYILTKLSWKNLFGR